MSNIHSISFQKYRFKVKIHMSMISYTKTNKVDDQLGKAPVG